MDGVATALRAALDVAAASHCANAPPTLGFSTPAVLCMLVLVEQGGVGALLYVRSPAVISFLPKYRLGLPGIYSFSVCVKIFSGSEYSKNSSFCLENRSPGHQSCGIACCTDFYISKGAYL